MTSNFSEGANHWRQVAAEVNSDGATVIIEQKIQDLQETVSAYIEALERAQSHIFQGGQIAGLPVDCAAQISQIVHQMREYLPAMAELASQANQLAQQSLNDIQSGLQGVG